MTTGLVLLAYGIGQCVNSPSRRCVLNHSFSFSLGSILGSILGGRWSDRILARLKAANDEVSYPEVRHR